MLLCEWLKKNKIRRTHFCAYLGMNRNYITRIIKGQRAPTLKMAFKIHEYTKGEVSLEELAWPNGREKEIDQKNIEE